jgi:predicted nucleic-acid-binding protein
MIAVDTNVVVRLLAHDDPQQEAVAQRLFESDTIWLAKTVLLETAWVLTGKPFGLDKDAIVQALRKLLDIRNVRTEDEAGVFAALDLIDCGLEFADAFHLAGRPHGSEFRTFDRQLIRRATRAGAEKVAEP